MKNLTTAAILCMLPAAPLLSATGLELTEVYTFLCNGNANSRHCPGGGRPNSIVQASDGNFYGTTQVSFEGTSHPRGGSLFSLTAGGQFTLLQTFIPGPNGDYLQGDGPFGLVEARDGFLYGATNAGGSADSGTLFRIAKDGTGFAVLHNFCSSANCADGSAAVPVLGGDGMLYGASPAGGLGNCEIACGAIYSLNPTTSVYEVLFNFGSATGGSPSALAPGSDGNFYGISGGRTLYRFTPPAGPVDTFPLALNESQSARFATQGPNGDFYGIFATFGGDGGVFEVEGDGTGLQLFPNNADAGSWLVSDEGNFWVPEFGGAADAGAIAVVSPANGMVINSITTFGPGTAAGANPSALIQASNGVFWGTSYRSGVAPPGQFADGVVYAFGAGMRR